MPAIAIIIHRPNNSGKSSLMNQIIGKNISAASNKSNTTHEKITGLYFNPEKHI